MDIPELVQQRLGGEQLRTGVMLGDDDVVCITATRTLLYRSDGLLSDERVDEFPHEIERLEVSEGRRKTKFVFEYVDGTESLSVPGDLAREVLGLLLEGALLSAGIIDEDESVTGAFRFSELTLVVTSKRVVKHVGNTVWEDDFESFAYEDLTGLEFEKASVATEIVLRIDGRPQRIKTPNDQARIVEQTVKKAIFEFFEVTSMDELDRHFDAEREDDEDTEPDRGDDDIGLEGGGGIDPLVEETGGDSPFEDPIAGGQSADAEPESPGEDTEPLREATEADDPKPERTERASSDRRSGSTDKSEAAQWPSEREQGTSAGADGPTKEDLERVERRLDDLAETVERQNEQLRDQRKLIKRLIQELKQGR